MILGVMATGLIGCTRHMQANAALLKANAERYRWITDRQKEMMAESNFDSIDSRPQPRRPIGGFKWSKR